MACPVQQVNDAPGELAGYYGNPPDGVRANMILSLDGAAEFDGLAGPLSNPTDQQARGLRRILSEGGPLLLDELINADLVDEMCLTISPTLAGGPPVGHVSAPALRRPTRLQLAHALSCDDYLFLRYRR